MVTPIRVFFASAAALAFVACGGYGALREGRYEDVPARRIHRAGESGDAELVEPLAALLLEHTRNPIGGVTSAQAVEAAIALGNTVDPRAADALLESAGANPSADVRYFSIESLAQVDAALLQENAPQLLANEQDAIVRDAVTRAMEGR